MKFKSGSLAEREEGTTTYAIFGNGSGGLPEESSEEKRGLARKNLFLAASLVSYGGTRPVKVRNMSSKGAMVEASTLPCAGEPVTLVRGGLAAEGRVIWCQEGRCGLTFNGTLSIAEWLAPPANAEQRRVDQDIAMVRAGITPLPSRVGSLPHLATREPCAIDEQLLSDLGTVVKLLGDLEECLISEPATVEKHGIKLQNIDLATQLVTAIARIIASQGEEQRSNLAKLSDLRVSCGQAIHERS